MKFEMGHLREELLVRDPERLRSFEEEAGILPHPMFIVEAGPIAPWERTAL
jgi:hypothetical protein